MMSKEELDIVQMTLITRIEEEIGWLNIMKNSQNPRKSIENRIVRCGEELKREMSNIYEQADKIEDLTMKYLEDIGIVHRILERNNLRKEIGQNQIVYLISMFILIGINKDYCIF